MTKCETPALVAGVERRAGGRLGSRGSACPGLIDAGGLGQGVSGRGYAATGASPRMSRVRVASTLMPGPIVEASVIE